MYNLNFYSVCLGDLQDIVEIDYQEFRTDNLDLSWRMDDYIFYLTSKSYVITVAKNRKIIGFCISSVSGNESELYKIVVKGDYRGKKIGKFILIYHLGFLKFKGIRVSFLEVAVNNHKAINLYTNMGYKKIGLRREYYGKVDAFLMRKDL